MPGGARNDCRAEVVKLLLLLPRVTGGGGEYNIISLINCPCVSLRILFDGIARRVDVSGRGREPPARLIGLDRAATVTSCFGGRVVKLVPARLNSPTLIYSSVGFACRIECTNIRTIYVHIIYAFRILLRTRTRTVLVRPEHGKRAVKRISGLIRRLPRVINNTL